MNCNITRVFHPIGQGAFYTERHHDININVVYDCGEWKSSHPSGAKLVKNSFPKGASIDILFISHFDFDHVSLIETLKTEFAIKTCIMPLLHPNEIAILLSYYETIGNKISGAIIGDPHGFFGKSTKIIYIESEYEENADPIELDQLNDNQKIKSGKPIKLKDWIYVPYNKNYNTVHDKLGEKFLANKLDYAAFTKDISYSSKHRSKIRTIYNSLPKGINFNSMLIYSGPAIRNCHIIRHFHGKSSLCFYHWMWPAFDDTNAGCIYTGDADLTEIDICSIFNKYWKNMGTIQIPHHGDRDSFDELLLKKQCHFIFPISYGTKNTYGHPSNQLTTSIVGNNSTPVFINENADSIYIQILKYDRVAGSI